MSEEEKPAENAQPLPFPRTHVQFGPLGAGFQLQILLSNDLAIIKSFDAQAEGQIGDLLLQRRKEVKELQRKELQVIRHVNTHK